MQLGAILDADSGAYCVGEPVKFFLMNRTETGLHKVEISAVLYPVSEAERITATRVAEEYLRAKPEFKEKEAANGTRYLPPIPQWMVSEELELRMIAAMLHDADDTTRKLVDVASYERFRRGINENTISALTKAYKAYLKREYPEAITEVQLKELQKEAEGNSKAAHS